MRKIGERICQDIKNLWPAAIAVIIYTVLVKLIFHAFCPMVVVTGFPCPGCGMTRSLFFLLTGRIGQSVWIHPMGIPIAGLICYFLWNRYILGRTAKGMKGLIIAAIVLLVVLYGGCTCISRTDRLMFMQKIIFWPKHCLFTNKYYTP